jgi:hypothetical protein
MQTKTAGKAPNNAQPFFHHQVVFDLLLLNTYHFFLYVSRAPFPDNLHFTRSVFGENVSQLQILSPGNAES